LSLIAAVAVNALFFAYAAWRKTDVVTDLSYSLSFALVAVALIVLNPGAGLVALIPAALTFVWALRLGSYLFTRIIKTKVDHRFDGMREHPLKFANFWILQTIAVTLILLPVAGAVQAASRLTAFGPLQIAAVVLWAAGFLIEVVADSQKAVFKSRSTGGFISSGLWAWSRHPNYFGETLLWWAAFVYVLPALSGAAYLTVVGPVFITFLLLKVSGIPLLEKSADAKHGNDPAYVEYKRRTSVFVLLPPKPRAAEGVSHA
jgi:steroid 5-alpha reductase family enzyme